MMEHSCVEAAGLRFVTEHRKGRVVRKTASRWAGARYKVTRVREGGSFSRRKTQDLATDESAPLAVEYRGENAG